VALLAPFQVDPEDIERLGAGFTQYVNDLLDSEASRIQLLGHQLRTDSRTSTADGGVDATLDSPTATKWISAGQSCWQFKSGDLTPASCEKELDGAKWAQTLIGEGASYTLVTAPLPLSHACRRRRHAPCSNSR
jgi:hypothetical protein